MSVGVLLRVCVSEHVYLCVCLCPPERMTMCVHVSLGFSVCKCGSACNSVLGWSCVFLSACLYSVCLCVCVCTYVSACLCV